MEKYISVISWFKQIPIKEKNKFIKFDIVDFYPSITEDLLMKSLNYLKLIEAIDEKVVKVIVHSRTIEAIDEKVVKVIMNSRKSLLFDRDNAWVKKENPNVDVTMGSYDGVELCELTGLYILNALSSKFGKEKIGLYRDDGLRCFQNMAGPQAERVKKKICEIFESCGLKITIKTNLQITDFLENFQFEK